MDDLLCSNVNPVIFFIYIGFNLAAFAFLCQYLGFPQSLLRDLSSMICTPPPRITDNRVVRLNEEKLKNIICFFFEIDMITFTLLMYILYSILVVLAFSGVHFRILPSTATRLGVFVISIFYSVLIFRLLYLIIWKRDKGAEEIKRDYFWTSRHQYAIFELLSLIFLLCGVFIILLVWKKAMLLFLFLIAYLVILLGCYLFSIAQKRPVRNVLSLWLGNQPCPRNESETTSGKKIKNKEVRK